MEKIYHHIATESMTLEVAKYVLFQIRESQVVLLRVLNCMQDLEGKFFE